VLLGAAPHHFPLPVTRGLTGDPKPGKWHIHLTAEIKKKKGRALGWSKTNHSFETEGRKRVMDDMGSVYWYSLHHHTANLCCGQRCMLPLSTLAILFSLFVL